MNTKTMKVSDLLCMPLEQRISRSLFQRLVVESKNPSKELYEGKDWYLGNTPQQGIHWIKAQDGRFKAAIVKMTGKSYTDRFMTQDKEMLYYHLKAQNGEVNRTEEANRALIEQPAHGYPVLVLDGHDGGDWIYRGRYEVISEDGKAVTLRRMRG